MNFSIYKIYKELMKKGMTLEAIRNDRYPRHKIIREIADEFNSWEYGVLELMDVRNWNLGNLVLEKPDRYVRGQMHYESNIRNPKAYFELFITSKGNLSLDWYPYNPNFPGLAKEKWDWTHWDNKWPIGGTHLPFNRVFMIRGFDSLMRGRKNKTYNLIDQYILEAVKKLTNKIYSFLDRFLDIEKVTDLYLEYEGRIYGNKIIGCSIRNVKEVKRETFLHKKEEWIIDTCSEFKISPEQVLEAFKKNDMKYAPTARMISSKSATLTASKAKKLVREIYGFPEIYDPIIDKPPPGVEARSKGAEVIKLQFGK